MPNISFRHASARCDLALFRDGTYSLVNLHSRDRGRGHAKALLRKVCDYADENDITMRLTVQAYSPPDRGLTNAQLEVLYSRYGFVRVSKLNGRVQMVRYSQKLHAS